MTLENTLKTKLADPRPPGQDSVAVPHGNWTVSVAPQQNDAIGCSVNDLTIERAAPLPGDQKAWAERIAKKATGLLEPLKLLEVDAGRQTTVLRSAEPTPKETGVHYYEVQLNGMTKANVRRYEGHTEPSQKREQVPFTLTYEGLAKLIGDVTDEK